MRLLPFVVLVSLVAATSACSPQPAPPESGSPGRLVGAADSNTALGGITPERIAQDVIGHTIEVESQDGRTPPLDWTFDPNEVRNVEILEREAGADSAAITVLMTTRSDPDAEEDPLELSGKLKLQYGREGSRWELKGIENLTFRYRPQVGITI